MTTEEIIASLEDQVKDRESSIDETDPDCIFRKDAEALREAAKLLRRDVKGVEIDPVKTVKLDRSWWKGCEMCSTKYTKKDWNTENVGAHEFRVYGDSLMYCDQFYGWEGIRINFCPICGRPLTEKAWAESEKRIGVNDETD